MAKVLVRAQIDVPVERLWRLVADFGDVRWIPGGESARTQGDGPGMIRIMGVGPAEIHERLESRDDAARTIIYTIQRGLPMPITGYRATMIVRPAGDARSELEWSSTFTPDGVSEQDAEAQVEGLYQMMIGWIREFLAK